MAFDTHCREDEKVIHVFDSKKSCIFRGSKTLLVTRNKKNEVHIDHEFQRDKTCYVAVVCSRTILNGIIQVLWQNIQLMITILEKD